MKPYFSTAAPRHDAVRGKGLAHARSVSGVVTLLLAVLAIVTFVLAQAADARVAENLIMAAGPQDRPVT